MMKSQLAYLPQKNCQMIWKRPEAAEELPAEDIEDAPTPLDSEDRS